MRLLCCKGIAMTFRRFHFAALLGGVVFACAASSANAQVTMTPLSTWGTNGWLAPGANAFVTTGTTERGLAFGNGHVYLVSRAGGNNVEILDQNSGSIVGSLSTTGISGGTFAVSAAAVGGDGQIYVGNLTTQSTTSAVQGLPMGKRIRHADRRLFRQRRIGRGPPGRRFGGDWQRQLNALAAGYSNSPSVTGNNGFAIVNPSAASATAVGFSGTPPNAGDFRLGLSFVDASDVMGIRAVPFIAWRTFPARAVRSRPARRSPTPPEPREIICFRTMWLRGARHCWASRALATRT